MKMHTTARQLRRFSRRLKISVKNFQESGIQYRPFGESELAHAFSAVGYESESEMLLMILEMLKQYGKLLKQSEKFLGKEQYISNLKMQLELYFQQMERTDIREVKLLREIFQQYNDNMFLAEKSINNYKREIIYNSIHNNVNVRNGIAIKTVSPEKLEQRFPYAELPSSGEPMFELFKYLYQQQEKKEHEKLLLLRKNMRQWVINASDVLQKLIWNRLKQYYVLGKSGNSVYDNEKLSFSQKLNYFFGNDSDEKMITAFRIISEEEMKRQIMLKQISESEKQAKADFIKYLELLESSERQTLKKILIENRVLSSENIIDQLENLTENKRMEILTYLQSKPEKNEVITELAEYLKSRESVLEYWKELNEKDRKMLTEILMENRVLSSENIVNQLENLTENKRMEILTYLQNRSEKNEIILEFAEYLKSRESILEYWRNLNENERKMLTELLMENRILSSENIIDQFENLTENKRAEILTYLQSRSEKKEIILEFAKYLKSRERDYKYYKILNKFGHELYHSSNLLDKNLSNSAEKHLLYFEDNHLNTLITDLLYYLPSLEWQDTQMENEKAYNPSLSYAQNAISNGSRTPENMEEYFNVLQNQLIQQQKEIARLQQQSSQFSIPDNELYKIRENIYREISREVHNTMRRNGK